MTVDESLDGVRAGPRAGRRARLVAARLRLDGVRLPVHRAPSTRHRPSRSRRRLLELGVDEVCFGDTIGVGVPPQVARRSTARAVGRRASRSSGSPSTSTTRAARRSRTSRPALVGRRSAASTPRPAAPAAARTPRARPATSRPRTSSTSSTRSGCEHGVVARRRPRGRPVHRRRPRQAARDEGRPGRRLGPATGRDGRD